MLVPVKYSRKPCRTEETSSLETRSILDWISLDDNASSPRAILANHNVQRTNAICTSKGISAISTLVRQPLQIIGSPFWLCNRSTE